MVEAPLSRDNVSLTLTSILDEVLSTQKPSSDKTSLGYVVSSSPSSSMASGSRTVFVPQFEKCDKGMKSKTDMANSKSFV